MKRDMHLIKRILKYVEKNSGNGQLLSPPDIAGYDDDIVEYHVRLCIQAGYINTAPQSENALRELTWDGHNALAELRKEDAC